MKRLIALGLSACCLFLSGCFLDGGSHPDVNDLNAQAQASYDAGTYQDSLTLYAEAMKTNPMDVNAILGAARCQIALENYDMAATNLSAAAQVDPQNLEIYDLYIQLSDLTGQIGYAHTAVNLAKNYQVEPFLEKVPEAPQFDIPDGNLNGRTEVSVTVPEGTEVYIQESRSNLYTITYRYAQPFTISRGDTQLAAYSLKDGVPSTLTFANYSCDYPSSEIVFADPVMESLVRMTLNRPSGPITDRDCEQVVSLNIRDLTTDYSDDGPQLQSLQDLMWFPNLQTLQLDRQNNISDYSPLQLCRYLSSLHLSNCGIQDLSFLQNTAMIQTLYLSDNEIRDLTPLAGYQHLYTLQLNGNPIATLEPLYGVGIEQLSLDMNQLPDLSALLNFPGLIYLNLNDCGGQDLSLLGQLTDLQSLYLYSSEAPLTDITFLQNLTNLTNLSMYGLTDYSQAGLVKNLTKLQYLTLRTIDYADPPSGLQEELKQSLPNCDIWL